MHGIKIWEKNTVKSGIKTPHAQSILRLKGNSKLRFS